MFLLLHLTTPSCSGQDAVKMDVQPKCLAVGPGGYTVVLCIGQVSINNISINILLNYVDM